MLSTKWCDLGITFHLLQLHRGTYTHISNVDHATRAQMEISNDLVCMPALDRKRTVSLSTADVIKHIEGLDTDDVSAMKQAAWDIAQQVRLDIVHCRLV